VPTAPASSLVCSACGVTFAADAETPFRCPGIADDPAADHVLVPRLAAGVRWPTGSESHPFIRYRMLLHSWHRFMARGGSDAGFQEMVEELDHKIAAIEGHGFAETPCEAHNELIPGAVAMVKDETRNPGGTHKSRHLFGVLLHLEVDERTGLRDPNERTSQRLAIASCGNAAVAAAVLARATERPLDVFVPSDVHETVAARLGELGAAVHRCPQTDEGHGDPCVIAFRKALWAGAIPFCCQGPECGLTLDGGRTLAFEFADALHAQGREMDRLFIQVGGGALAASVFQGFVEAAARGRISQLPQLHAVQTENVAPLLHAWRHIRVAEDPEDALSSGARNRAWLLTPWETPGQSVASAILDKEVHDGRAVLTDMVMTEGWPVVVDEETLQAAATRGPEITGIAADATGTAGLAGAMRLSGDGTSLDGRTIGLLFTGTRR